MSRSFSQGASSNELNLARYVQVLLRFWWLIAAAGIIGALLGFYYATLQPVSYRAEAALAIVRTGLVLNLDARARTISDTDPNAQSVDQIARRSSLTAIGESDDTGAAVIQALGSPPLPGLNTLRGVNSHVNILLDTDVIRIQTTMPTAEQAALLANTFARVYEQRVNTLLGESALSAGVLAAQTAQARDTYQAKQDAVVKYLAASPIESLKRQADALSAQLDAQAFLQAKLAQLEEDAVALQARVKNSASTPIPGAQVAQLLLEANAFNNETNSTANVLPRIDLTGANFASPTAAEQAQMLEGLIAAIRTRRQAQSATAREALIAELNRTQSDLEEAQANLKSLQADRDLAWNAYQLLSTKVAESNISAGSDNQIVRLISLAAIPSLANPSRSLLNVVIGAALGIIVGAGLAFLFDRLPMGRKRAAPADTTSTADNAAR